MATRSRQRRKDQTRPPHGPAPAELRAQLAAAGAPAGVLDALDGAGGIDEVIDRLVAAGMLPSPEQSLTAMLQGWAPLLRRGCEPLDAELAGAEFLATLRTVGADAADLPLLTEMIENVERASSPEALAMLRVLGAVGPGPVRPSASAAAERLVASGLADPAWVASLGRPKVGACFGYCDPFGAQEVLALSFGYGRRRHALAVLIDHALGGGVKDCYVAAQPRRIRDAYARSARNVGVDVEDYSPADAVAILDRALAVEPCPVEPDQVEDVDTYLVLLRERIELLRAEPPSTRRDTRRTPTTVHRLKITLRGSKPPIWRRVEVASDTGLDRLHDIVQKAFGWYGGHLWVFSTPTGEYGLPDPELGHEDAARRTLSAVAPRKGSRIRYTYDFGDDWEHEIVVEDRTAAEPGAAYPRCLTGRRARPPEDCGGMWGYHDLLEILADPDHPEHAEQLAWLGLETADQLDPARFDAAEINERLTPLARVVERS